MRTRKRSKRNDRVGNILGPGDGRYLRGFVCLVFESCLKLKEREKTRLSRFLVQNFQVLLSQVIGHMECLHHLLIYDTTLPRSIYDLLSCFIFKRTREREQEMLVMMMMRNKTVWWWWHWLLRPCLVSHTHNPSHPIKVSVCVMCFVFSSHNKLSIVLVLLSSPSLHSLLAQLKPSGEQK